MPHIGARELLSLARIRGLKNAMVSASPEDVESALSQFGLLYLFDKIRLRAWPKNVAFIETLQFFNVVPEQAFYVDDSFDGLSIAKSLGIRTIGFTGGYGSRGPNAAATPKWVGHKMHAAT